jgi:hypothetical protein
MYYLMISKYLRYISHISPSSHGAFPARHIPCSNISARPPVRRPDHMGHRWCETTILWYFMVIVDLDDLGVYLNDLGNLYILIVTI